jgi:hypothetical protein
MRKTMPTKAGPRHPARTQNALRLLQMEELVEDTAMGLPSIADHPMATMT